MPKASAVNRLEALIASARRVPAPPSGKEHTAGTLLAAVLDIDPKDIVGLHRAYLSVLSLIEDSEEEVHFAFELIADDDPQEAIARALRPLKSIHGSLIANTIYSPGSVLTQHHSSELELLALTVTKIGGEAELQGEQLKSIDASLGAILQDVTTAEFHHHFKAVFVYHIEQLQHAVHNYQIFGAPGVARAYGALIGHTLAQGRHLSQAQGAKVSSVLSRMADTLSVFWNSFEIGRQIGGPLLKFLSGGH